MPIPELVKFREKYPEYNDMGDSDLANSLATKYPDDYADLPGLLGKESAPSSEPSNESIFKQPEIQNRSPIEMIMKQNAVPDSASLLQNPQFKISDFSSPMSVLTKPEIVNQFVQTPAVASLVEGLQREEALVGNTLVSIAKGKASPIDLIKVGGKALTGEQISSIGNGLSEMGFDDFTSASAGFLASMLLPSNFIGGGIVGKVDKASKSSVKPLDMFIHDLKGPKGVFSEVSSKMTGVPKEDFETIFAKGASETFKEPYNVILPKIISQKISNGLNELRSTAGSKVSRIKDELRLSERQIDPSRLREQFKTSMDEFGFRQGKEYLQAGSESEFNDLQTMLEKFNRGDIQESTAFVIKGGSESKSIKPQITKSKDTLDLKESFRSDVKAKKNLEDIMSNKPWYERSIGKDPTVGTRIVTDKNYIENPTDIVGLKVKGKGIRSISPIEESKKVSSDIVGPETKLSGVKNSYSLDDLLNFRDELGDIAYSGFKRGGDKVISKPTDKATSVIRAWRSKLTKQIHDIAPELAKADREFVVASSLHERGAKFFDDIAKGEKILAQLDRESLPVKDKLLIKNIVRKISGGEDWIDAVRTNLTRRHFQDVIPKGVMQRLVGGVALGVGSVPNPLQPLGMMTALSTSPLAVKQAMIMAEGGSKLLGSFTNQLKSASARKALEEFTKSKNDGQDE